MRSGKVETRDRVRGEGGEDGREGEWREGRSAQGRTLARNEVEQASRVETKEARMMEGLS